MPTIDPTPEQLHAHIAGQSLERKPGFYDCTFSVEERIDAAELAALRKDAERYRWLRANNSHHLHNSAWLASLTAVKDGPCDIFSADEVPALLDAEIDRRMARAVGAA